MSKKNSKSGYKDDPKKKKVDARFVSSQPHEQAYQKSKGIKITTKQYILGGIIVAGGILAGSYFGLF